MLYIISDDIKLTTTMIGTALGLPARSAPWQTFVFAHVVVQPGERMEAPAAQRAVNLRFFVVFGAAHQLSDLGSRISSSCRALTIRVGGRSFVKCLRLPVTM